MSNQNKTPQMKKTAFNLFNKNIYFINNKISPSCVQAVMSKYKVSQKCLENVLHRIVIHVKRMKENESYYSQVRYCKAIYLLTGFSRKLWMN